jgi:FkbM family methyltransferase
MYPYWALPFAWYTRRELPGWWHLLSLLKVMPPSHDPLWERAPSLFMDLPTRGQVIQTDLRDCVERMCYFVGRHPDIEIDLCLRSLLKPGDRYIDVGAHIGMLAMPAATLVGREGEVLAFEPNPVNMSRLARCVGLNGISNIRLLDVALSDRTGEAAFNFPLASATRGSLMTSRAGDNAATFPVRTVKGDELLLPLDSRPTLMKVDVEGFEIEVLRGCREFVLSARPAMITECYGPNFGDSGATVAAFLKVMRSTGAQGFLLDISVKRLRRPRLKLVPLEQVPLERFETLCEDVLWLFEGTAMWDRAQQWMSA